MPTAPKRRLPRRPRASEGLSGKLSSSRPAKAPKIPRPPKSKALAALPPSKLPRKGLSSQLSGSGAPLAAKLGSIDGRGTPVESSASSAATLDGARAVQPAASQVLERGESSLLDIVDNLLNQGVVLSGDAVIGVADVDLIYLRLNAVLGAADKILGPGTAE